MFAINKDDLSIYITRGDFLFFALSVEEDDGSLFTFQPGDIVQIKVFGKKDCGSVYLQKKFPITEETDEVSIFLTKKETKFGELISKPKDYWYEIELNPDDEDSRTLIGYDEELGEKVFRLFPEGGDVDETEPDPEEIPVVDKELDLTSERPVQNQVVAREILRHNSDKNNPHGVTIQQIGAAPSGYGLGGDTTQRVVSVAELDNLVFNGWYRLDAVGSNIGGVRFNYASVFVTNRFHDSGVWQEVRPLNSSIVIRRYCTDYGVWSEWEIENPPMELGVEYRTTEYYMGKIVYAKAVDCGAFANGKVVTLELPFSYGVTVKSASIQGYLLPFFLPATGELVADIAVEPHQNGIALTCYSTGILDNLPAIIQLKYTKD